jgi:hypothetical protein
VSSTSSGAPAFPPCPFSPGVGYACPDVTTSSNSGVITVGPAGGTVVLTDNDVTYSSGNSTNRYVRITGAANAVNNGTFPILAVSGSHAIVYAASTFVTETIPSSGSHVNLAGVGAIPSMPDPGFLPDNVNMTISLLPGGGGHFASFNAMTPSVGDDFVASIATLDLLKTLPIDGSAFAMSCESGSCGGGSATGSFVEIITTDASTAGLSPFAMPPPVTRQLRIVCTSLASANITIPAAFSSQYATTTVTRAQATFGRLSLMGGAPTNVTATAGHAIIGYSNR